MLMLIDEIPNTIGSMRVMQKKIYTNACMHLSRDMETNEMKLMFDKREMLTMENVNFDFHSFA